MHSITLSQSSNNKPMHFPTQLLILLLSLVSLTSGANNFMSISQNRKYMNSGSVKIDIGTAVSWSPYSTNVTYPYGFANPVEGIFLTINDINIDNISGSSLSFYGIVNSFTQTSFTLYVYSSTVSKIKTLGYRYLAITMKDANTYGWILRTVIQSVSFSMPLYTSSSSFNVPVPLGGYYTLGFSLLNQYAISFLGYDIQTQTQFSYISYGIKISEGLYTNVASLTAQIAVSSNYYYYYMTTLSISNVHFNILIHNRSEDSRIPYIRSEYFKLGGPAQNSNGAFTYSGYSINAYNSYYQFYQSYKPNYYGLIYGPATLFSINYTILNTLLQFSLSVNDYSSNFTSISKNHAFGVTVTYFYSFYCPFATPYLLDNLCYDVCPDNSTTNQTALTCSVTTPSILSRNVTDNSVSSGVQAGSALGFVSFSLLIALIAVLVVLGICLARKWKQQVTQRKQVPRKIPYLDQTTVVQKPIYKMNQAQSKAKTSSETELGIWRERSMDTSEKCTICYNEQIYLKTDCNHSFHQEIQKCPNCNNNLTEKELRVLCRLCKLKEKRMNFSELRIKFQENDLSEEFVCPGCLMKSF